MKRKVDIEGESADSLSELDWDWDSSEDETKDEHEESFSKLFGG